MRHRIVVARRVTELVARRAAAEFDAVFAEGEMEAEEAIAAARAHGAAGLVTGPSSRFRAEHFEDWPEMLRVIANTSVGMDHMDGAAARARGVVVTNAPGVLTDCTADLAFLLILAALRRASEYGAIMRRGWREVYGMPDHLGLRAAGRTLGILGMGRIGQAVARRARGFGMPVLYHNRRRLDPAQEEGAEYVPSLSELLPRSQILSLNLPGGRETGVVMDAAAFARLPRGAVFVNTARGSVVDEEALLEALRSGHLFGAGLDVFRDEPDHDLRFRDLPNVFLTPHMASATVETRDAMGHKALDNAAAVLSGSPPLDPVP